MVNVVKLNVPYRTVVDLSEDGFAVIEKTGDRLVGDMVVEQAGGDIILRYADGHAVTVAGL